MVGGTPLFSFFCGWQKKPHCRALEEEIWAFLSSGIHLIEEKIFLCKSPDLHLERHKRVWHNTQSFSESLEEVQRTLRNLADLLKCQICSHCNHTYWYTQKKEKIQTETMLCYFQYINIINIVITDSIRNYEDCLLGPVIPSFCRSLHFYRITMEKSANLKRYLSNGYNSSKFPALA